MDLREPNEMPAFWRSTASLALAAAIAAAGFYLVVEHTAHVFGVLPYLLLLACPVMHMFMHHGHGHGQGQGQGQGGHQAGHDRPGSNDDEQHGQ
jgi:hypothetical protein